MSRPENIRRRNLLQNGAALAIGAALLPAEADAAQYPRLEKAVEEMKSALTFLENSKKGFGGHRKKAMDALNTAIAELQAAMEYKG